MATPRHLLVDPVNECDYHLVSRCVRRAFLCGVDEHADRDYSHRRAWLVQRLGQIAPCFAVDVYAYTVLSNHFHLVLRHDPLAHRGWSDEEVARRWVEAFPPTERGVVVEALKPERRELILDNPGPRGARPVHAGLDVALHEAPADRTANRHMAGEHNSLFLMFFYRSTQPAPRRFALGHYNEFATFFDCVPPRDSVSH